MANFLNNAVTAIDDMAIRFNRHNRLGTVCLSLIFLAVGTALAGPIGTGIAIFLGYGVNEFWVIGPIRHKQEDRATVEFLLAHGGVPALIHRTLDD